MKHIKEKSGLNQKEKIKDQHFSLVYHFYDNLTDILYIFDCDFFGNFYIVWDFDLFGSLYSVLAVFRGFYA